MKDVPDGIEVAGRDYYGRPLTDLKKAAPEVQAVIEAKRQAHLDRLNREAGIFQFGDES